MFTSRFRICDVFVDLWKNCGNHLAGKNRGKIAEIIWRKKLGKLFDGGNREKIAKFIWREKLVKMRKLFDGKKSGKIAEIIWREKIVNTQRFRPLWFHEKILTFWFFGFICTNFEMTFQNFRIRVSNIAILTSVPVVFDILRMSSPWMFKITKWTKFFITAWTLDGRSPLGRVWMSGFQVLLQLVVGWKWFLAKGAMMIPNLLDLLQMMFFQVCITCFDQNKFVSAKLTNFLAFASVRMDLQSFWIRKTTLTCWTKCPLLFGQFRMFTSDMIEHFLKCVKGTTTKWTWNLVTCLKQKLKKLKKNREFVKVCSAKIECKPCKQSYQV